MEYLYNKKSDVADENDVIGKRIRVHTAEENGETRVKYITPTGWKSLNEHLQTYVSKKEETFRYLLINTDGVIKHQLTITSHLPNFCNVSTENDETLKQVISKLEQDNLYLVVAHNHPSGNPSESSFDREVTESLSRSLKRNDGKNSFLGHIIIAGDKYNFCGNKCKWKTESSELAVKDVDQRNKWWYGEISGSSKLEGIGQKYKGKYPAIVFTNADRTAIAMKKVTDEWFDKTSDRIRYLLQATAKKVGAIGAFVVVPEKSNVKVDLIRHHILEDAFTDAYMNGYSVTSEFDIEAGRNFFSLFRDTANRNIEVKSTWERFISARLFPQN